MKQALRELLSLESGGQEYPLYLCGPGSSSMDAAWDFIRAGELPPWGAVLMESQQGGRGRMGRVWQSPPGHIYGALRLPEGPPFDGPGASLALAFFVAASLREMGAAIQIKWPNDLIIDGSKAGGILLESKPGGLVAGVGLNLVQAPGGAWVDEREAGAPRPGALPFDGGPLAVWRELVKRVIKLYSKKFESWTMAETAAEAESLLFWRERLVRVITPASEPQAPPAGLQGRIAGLASNGCLLLVNGPTKYKLWSGTVCLL